MADLSKSPKVGRGYFLPADLSKSAQGGWIFLTADFIKFALADMRNSAKGGGYFCQQI